MAKPVGRSATSQFLRFDVTCGHRHFEIAPSSAISTLNLLLGLMTKGFLKQTHNEFLGNM
jgi:hypothetical protein